MRLIILAIAALGLASCQPAPETVVPREPYVPTDSVEIKGRQYDVTPYKDPDGCQYLIFYYNYNGNMAVVPRMSPNTNGMCMT